MKYDVDECRWTHSSSCLSHSPLATGRGHWHCTCGYDAYLMIKEDADDYEKELTQVRAESAKLEEELRYVLATIKCRLKDCPYCEKETLWQHYEESDEFGWSEGEYCLECEYDPVKDESHVA